MSSKKENNVRLSYSKISTLDTCTLQYFYSYVVKLPQKSNAGSASGNCLHLVIECLGNPRHKHYVKKIIKKNSIKSFPAIVKLVEREAKKNDLDLNEMASPLKPPHVKDVPIQIFDCIDSMIVFCLNYNENRTDEKIIESEWAFDIKTDKFWIKGFSDQMSERISDPEVLIYRDWKGSRELFSKKKLEFSIQALMYFVAARYDDKYKKYKKREFDFVFPRFADRKKAQQTVPNVSEEVLDGFEEYLGYLTKYLANFTMDKARSNTQAGLTRYNGGGLCYSDKTGWRCPYYEKMDYWHLIDKDGNVVNTALDGKPRREKEGCTWVKKTHEGCMEWVKKS